MHPDRRRTVTILAAFVAVLCLLAPVRRAAAQARTWTDDLNRTWQGEFLRVDGPSVVFQVSGKEYPFPLARLSAADKLVIFKLRQAPPVAAATPAPAPDASAIPAGSPPAASIGVTGGGTSKEWSFGDAKLQPGRTTETTLPLSSEYSQAFTKYYEAQAPVTHILASLAVPADFDGDKAQKVLVVSVTANGEGGSIPIAKNTYTKDALTHGWLVLAADGPDGKPKHGNDNILYRLDLLKVALAELNTRFPKAKADWTFATAGFSGGCGYASHQALYLSAQGYRVGGMMLLNGGYTPNEWEPRPELHGNTSHWHQIPVFISWGENDTIAVPTMMKKSIDTTKRLYQRVRAESHPGKHEAWHAHINLSLEWFDSLAGGAGH